ncbi:MAG: response regulator [Patescibacteria group bacterium]|jgi:DNA-binding response OmpR family regulator
MLDGKVILIADDDLTLLEMYADRFKQEGAIVEVAHDGKEAVRMAEENHPHLIILDIMMPGLNGFEVLQVLKQSDVTKDIPVIIYTVLLEADKYAKAKELGADEFIVKSDVLPIDVIKKVSEVLDRHRPTTKDA